MTHEPPLFVFAGGGTGGHLYPALAVAEALRQKLGRVRFTFFTSRRSIDSQILADHEAEVQTQNLAPLSPLPWRWPRILLRIRAERARLRQYLQVHRPAAVVGTGGLTSVPAILAARDLRVPSAIFNPDAVPGKANRFLAKRADVVLAQWADSIAHFPSTAKVETLGCPVRSGFLTADREAAARTFGLDPSRRTLLITGASQGARTINEAVIANLDLFESRSHANWQILHLTGAADHELVQAAYTYKTVKAVVIPYTNEMPAAMLLADLIISRSGASTLAEITAVGRASILMPYPFHRDMHQLSNAMCLARNKAAEIVNDSKDVAINAPVLRKALERLVGDDALRDSMAATARKIGNPHAAENIARRLIDIAVMQGTLEQPQRDAAIQSPSRSDRAFADSI